MWTEDKCKFILEYTSRLDVYIGVEGEFYKENENEINK